MNRRERRRLGRWKRTSSAHTEARIYSADLPRVIADAGVGAYVTFGISPDDTADRVERLIAVMVERVVEGMAAEQHEPAIIHVCVFPSGEWTVELAALLDVNDDAKVTDFFSEHPTASVVVMVGEAQQPKINGRKRT